jgi:hypothetical protein
VSDLVQAHLAALRHLRAGGASSTLNCGYGHGYSVLDVIDTVKRVSRVDFRVDIGGRRVGDPAQIIAASDRARATLGWQPKIDNLHTIVGHPLLGSESAQRGTEQHDTGSPVTASKSTPQRTTKLIACRVLKRGGWQGWRVNAELTGYLV